MAAPQPPLTARLDALTDAARGGAGDAFLRGSPFAAYQQGLAWAAAAPRSARRAWRYFECREGEATIGAAVIRCTRLAPGRWLATIQRGPVVADPARLDAVLGELKRVLRGAGCTSLQIAPRVRGRDLPLMAEAMRRHGFVPLPAGARALHDITGIVWLDKPEVDILAGFKQRARRALRAAEKAGITVRPASGAADIARYQDLLDRFAASRPDYDMSGQPDAAAQAALIAACGGAMLIAERDGGAIGGHAFVRQADEAIWLSLAVAERDGVSPGYPLLWSAMRTARAAGCVGYDLAGLPAEDAALDPGEAGRVQFKTAFAPHRRVMPPMQMAALRPVSHHLLYTARAAYRGLARRRAARG